MSDNELNIKRRNLPHWKMHNATYFITFNTKNTIFSKDEQTIVLNHIIDGNKKYYVLYAAGVMPDHVHIILQPHNTTPLSRIMKGIKGVSSRIINQQRNCTGSIWQDESYDRIIRDEKEFLEKMKYLLDNPVKLGLTDEPLNYYGIFISNE